MARGFDFQCDAENAKLLFAFGTFASDKDTFLRVLPSRSSSVIPAAFRFLFCCFVEKILLIINFIIIDH